MRKRDLAKILIPSKNNPGNNRRIHGQFRRPWTRAYTILNPLCIKSDAAARRNNKTTLHSRRRRRLMYRNKKFSTNLHRLQGIVIVKDGRDGSDLGPYSGH